MTRLWRFVFARQHYSLVSDIRTKPKPVMSSPLLFVSHN